jgi:hypothetical protein
MEKPNKSFRLSPALLEKAKAIDLPITEIFEAALASALKHDECPFCHQEYKPKTSRNALKLVLELVNDWSIGGNIMHNKEFMEKLDKIIAWEKRQKI